MTDAYVPESVPELVQRLGLATPVVLEIRWSRSTGCFAVCAIRPDGYPVQVGPPRRKPELVRRDLRDLQDRFA